MYRIIRLCAIVLLLAACVFAVSPTKTTTAASVTPSWEILQGIPNSCVSPSGSLVTRVRVNNPSAASEKGTFSVQGVGNVGYTIDPSFAGVNPNIAFGIFLNTSYSVAPHTPVTLTVTTYKLPNYAGGVSYTSTLTWDCTTGGIVAASTEHKALFPDERLDKESATQTAAAYCLDDGSLRVYVYAGTPSWAISFTATQAEIDKVPTNPAKNTLIKQGWHAQLYRLTTGELQINAPGVDPAKGDYVFQFKGCGK